jgi:hypothetical protein
LSDFITVNGVPPYDGRYELDMQQQPFTTREWGWVKRHAGYLPLTLERSSFTDPDFVIVQAIVAMWRAGAVAAADVPALVERFQDVDPFAAITYEADDTDAEDDAVPPPSSSDAKPNSNGASSPTGSEISDSHPSATGSRASDTSASAPQMSVT